MNAGASAPAIGFCIEVVLLAAVFGNGAAAVDEEHAGKSGMCNENKINENRRNIEIRSVYEK